MNIKAISFNELPLKIIRGSIQKNLKCTRLMIRQIGAVCRDLGNHLIYIIIKKVQTLLATI